jgi:hypothetical protein
MALLVNDSTSFRRDRDDLAAEVQGWLARERFQKRAISS